MKRWNVMQNGVSLDTVYFLPTLTAEDVKTSLIEHDFYPADITVVEDLDYIDPAAWYCVSSQGVERGPYASYKEARAACDEVYMKPMIGEQVIELIEEMEEF